MKITTFLLLLGCIHASATSYGQKVTLSEHNASLEQIIRLLKQQTGYDFLYSADLQADTRKVNIEANNQELPLVLNRLFGNNSFSYAISDKTVVISSKVEKDQQRRIQGKVLDENRKPLASASVYVEGGTTTTTNLDGMFTLENIGTNSIIRITYMGYDTRSIKVSDVKGFLEVIMRQSENTLEEANVVSTGYYTLPKERATGSFEHVDNKLFNRNVGMDVISRLKGVTTSTIFGDVDRPPIYVDPSSNTLIGGRKINAVSRLQIRGISTLSNNNNLDAGTPSGQPLIILDNFPYEGDITNINPNDVESITVLKDAAASSIWGSRSANGVIVITTKKGKLDQPLRISVNSNISVTARPDLYYGPWMSSSDFVDIERFNFKQGTYDWFAYDPIYTPVSPVVDLLFQQQTLPQTDVAGRSAIDAQIDAYRKYDSRKDISKYLYRKGILQQYSMNLSGGGRQFSYYLSAGYDHNRNNEVNTYNSRKNLQSRMSFKPLKNLEFNADIRYNNAIYHTPSTLFKPQRLLNKIGNLPYTRLADEQGEPLEVINGGAGRFAQKHTYRQKAGNGRLLDWSFFPLKDINTNYGESNVQELLTNFGVRYQILPSLRTSVDYQYTKSGEYNTQFLSRESFYMRDLINSYALYDKNDPNGLVNYQVPIGDAFGQMHIPRSVHNVRGQLNFTQVFGKRHEVDAILGAELNDAKITGGPYLKAVIGYNQDPMFFRPMNYDLQMIALNGDAGLSRVELNPFSIFPSYVSRSTSAYLNASYSYDKRYTLSMSGRIDGANIFGVAASNRIKPNWSIGGAWNIHKERFFNADFIELLKLRATYGYMGNVNNTVAAYPTINYVNQTNNTTGLTYATIGNGPNPKLSPERTAMVNLGLDFAIKGNRLSGNLEWYQKRSMDLIAPVLVDNSTGYASMMRNSADMTTNGFDINLRSVNVRSLKFEWSSNILVSHTRSVVTKYILSNWSDDASNYVPENGTIYPNLYKEGKSPFTLYTYKFAGLDPQTGDPMGYDVNGNITKNYGEILGQKYKDLEDHGSIIPLYYGAFRNTCQYKSFSLSINILYKFKYKLSRGGYNEGSLFYFLTGALPEYDQRWQKPGDEANIDAIPSIIPNSSDSQRGQFFAKSSARVFSADHIRLQDIRLDYSFPRTGHILRSMQVYCNITNLGIIWRANKFGIDPETLMQPPVPRTVTLGFNASF